MKKPCMCDVCTYCTAYASCTVRCAHVCARARYGGPVFDSTRLSDYSLSGALLLLTEHPAGLWLSSDVLAGAPDDCSPASLAAASA